MKTSFVLSLATAVGMMTAWANQQSIYTSSMSVQSYASTTQHGKTQAQTRGASIDLEERDNAMPLLQLNLSSDADVKIYADGKLLSEKTYRKGKHTLSTENYPSGEYLLTVQVSANDKSFNLAQSFSFGHEEMPVAPKEPPRVEEAKMVESTPEAPAENQAEGFVQSHS